MTTLDIVILCGVVFIGIVIVLAIFALSWANDVMKAIIRLKRILDSHGIYD